jgi:hypothetical protein
LATPKLLRQAHLRMLPKHRAVFETHVGEWPSRWYGGSVHSRGWGRHRIVGEDMSGDHSTDPLRELAAEWVALAERTNDQTPAPNF